MKVQVTHKDVTKEIVNVGKFVSPYPIEDKVKKEIVRLQKSEDDEIAYGWFSFEGKDYPISKVVICGKPTWFIEGHPVVTVLEYMPTKVCYQIKLARGNWGNGERRKEYQAFVYSLLWILGGGSLPCFPDNTCDYINELTSIDCNGLHPFNLINKQ